MVAIMVTEAWQLPEDHPDRKEVMVYNFLAGNNQLVAICPIDREAKTITPGPFIDPTGFMGRLLAQDTTNMAMN